MLARKTTLVFVNTILGGILGFVALKVIALYMGAGVYGQLAFAIGLLGILSFLMDLGFRRAHIKRVSEGQNLGDCIATYLGIGAGLAVVYMALVLGGLAVYLHVLDEPLVSTTLAVIVIVGLFNALEIIRKVGASTFYALKENARAEMTTFTEHLVRVPLMVLFALFYASGKGRQGPIFDGLRSLSPRLAELVATHGADFLAVAMLSAAVASAAVSVGLLHRHHPIGDFDWELARSYGVFAAPLVVGMMVSSVSTYIDKATLGFFWSDAAVGRYYGVQRILMPVNLISTSVATVLLPSFSELHSSGDHEAADLLGRTSLRYISMVTVPMAFGATVLARPAILLLLSRDFIQAAPIVGVLGFAFVVQGISVSFGQSILGSNRPKLWTSTGIVSSVVGIVMVLVLVPDSLFGIPAAGLRGLGAALGVLTAAVTNLLLQARLADVDLPPGFLYRLSTHWFAGLVMAAVVFYVHAEIFALTRWFHALGFVAFGAGVYFGVLALIGEFTRQDLDFFWAALHPGDMGRYIRDELRGEDR